MAEVVARLHYRERADEAQSRRASAHADAKAFKKFIDPMLKAGYPPAPKKQAVGKRPKKTLDDFRKR